MCLHTIHKIFSSKIDFGMNISFGMTRCHFETDTNFHPKQTKTQLFSSKTNQTLDYFHSKQSKTSDYLHPKQTRTLNYSYPKQTETLNYFHSKQTTTLKLIILSRTSKELWNHFSLQSTYNSYYVDLLLESYVSRFPKLSSPRECQNKIPRLSRFFRTPKNLNGTP